jgi:hypothetical protein
VVQEANQVEVAEPAEVQRVRLPVVQETNQVEVAETVGSRNRLGNQTDQTIKYP